MATQEQLRQAIAAQEALRETLGDVVVDATIAVLKEQLRPSNANDPAEKQRKMVTVLFADVSGFTAMSERLDAEDVSDIMGALWERVDHVINQYGGYIDKHIGDAVMALWGNEIAREDDPDRTIRAALAMQKVTRELRESMNLPTSFTLRIGINTGFVLLGEIGSKGEYTAMGDAVNIASRLEHAAPLGGILISHETLQHVPDIYDVLPQPPLKLKGKSEPLQVYLVEKIRPRLYRIERRGVAGIETRMIGRQKELAKLAAQFKDSLQGDGRLLMIMGEAGVGKSRLLYEFEKWLDLRPEKVFHFRGRCGLQAQTQPLGLIKDMFKYRFEILDSDPTEEVYAKMEEGMCQFFPRSEDPIMRAHLIGQMLGFDFRDSWYVRGILDDPKQIKMRGTTYLARYLRTVSRKQPTVIFLEDLHWADEASLELLLHLINQTADQPVLWVCLSRPGLLERHPQWQAAMLSREQLDLLPLDYEESKQLIAEILQRMAIVPAALQELIIRHAEGNPFYVEELIKMLLEDQVIQQEADNWEVDISQLNQLRVPATLAGVLQARLDSLSSSEKRLLQQAAVVGRIFWSESLEEMQDYEKRAVAEMLESLTRRELIVREKRSSFAQTEEFRFKHPMLQDVAYQQVLKRDRIEYHARIADWLILYSGERQEESAGMIASHLQAAGRSSEAAAYLLQAAVLARETGNLTDALQYVNQGLNVREAMPQLLQLQLLQARELVYDLLGERDLQQLDLMQLAKMVGLRDDSAVNELGSSENQGEIALRQSNYALVTSDFAVAATTAKEAVAAGEAASLSPLTVRARIALGNTLWRQGAFEEADACFLTALEQLRQLRLPKLVADAHRGRGIISYLTGDGAAATEQWESALELTRTIGDRQGEAKNLNNLGLVANNQSDYEIAASYYRQALLVMQETGDKYSEGTTYNNLGTAASVLGQYAEAESYFGFALDIMREIGHRDGEAIALSNLGNILHKRLVFDEAKQYLTEALTLLQEIGHQEGIGLTLNSLGNLALDQGDAVTAESFYKQSEKIHEGLHQLQHLVKDHAGLSSAALALGALDKAMVWQEKILAYLAENPRLDGVWDPFRVFLSCIALFHAEADPRGQEMLEGAYQMVQRKAARISDPALRHSFLTTVKEHRSIVHLWEQRNE